MKHLVSKCILTLYAIIVMFATFQYVDTAHAGVDPFLGEMSYVAFDFAPRGWAFCDGQVLSVSANSALFSLLGTTYGGDGRITFGLPDMRGRVPIHAGRGPGLSAYRFGSKGGLEWTELAVANLPAHNHLASASSESKSTISGGGGTGTVKGTLKGSSSFATTDDPSGNTLAKPYWGPALAKTTVKAYNSEAPSVSMHEGSVTLDLSSISLGDVTTTTDTTVAVGLTGRGSPFNNLQPFTVVRCIIAVTGIFPSRN